MTGKGFIWGSDGTWNYDEEWLEAEKLFKTAWPDEELRPEELGIQFLKDEKEA